MAEVGLQLLERIKAKGLVSLEGSNVFGFMWARLFLLDESEKLLVKHVSVSFRSIFSEFKNLIEGSVTWEIEKKAQLLHTLGSCLMG